MNSLSQMARWGCQNFSMLKKLKLVVVNLSGVSYSIHKTLGNSFIKAEKMMETLTKPFKRCTDGEST